MKVERERERERWGQAGVNAKGLTEGEKGTDRQTHRQKTVSE